MKTIGELACQLQEKYAAFYARPVNERTGANLPDWAHDLVQPIADALLPRLPGYYARVLGPFGINAHVSIFFTREKFDPDSAARDKFEGDNTFGITFRPVKLGAEKVVLGLVDEATDTGHYAPGTIGALNGGNHPVIELEASMEIDELFMELRDGNGNPPAV